MTHKPVGVLGCLVCGKWIGDESVHDVSGLVWQEPKWPLTPEAERLLTSQRPA